MTTFFADLDIEDHASRPRWGEDRTRFGLHSFRYRLESKEGMTYRDRKASVWVNRDDEDDMGVDEAAMRALFNREWRDRFPADLACMAAPHQPKGIRGGVFLLGPVIEADAHAFTRPIRFGQVAA